MKKILLMISTLLLLIGCANPSIIALRKYEMETARGRDEAFYAALKMTEIERLGVEEQFARQGLENALLISAFVRVTNMTPEQVMSEKVFTYAEVLQLVDEINKDSEKRKSEIKATYRAFFDKIDEEDVKIKAIQEGVQKAQEARYDGYKKAGEHLGTSLATIGITAAIAP